jgi:hypothetical protein
MSMWSTAGGDWGMTSMEADWDDGERQSTTACCPRQTIPDSCSCLENCTCTCKDCDCGAWWDADEREDDE